MTFHFSSSLDVLCVMISNTCLHVPFVYRGESIYIPKDASSLFKKLRISKKKTHKNTYISNYIIFFLTRWNVAFFYFFFI